jgi:signal transduction histidine kinase
VTALNGGVRPDPIRCWEWLKCKRVECAAYGSSDLRCWLVPHASCHDGSVEVAPRLLSECGTCRVYSANRDRARGKRGSDLAMLDTVDALVAESVERSARLGRVEVESRSRSAQVTLLSEVGRALQRSMELDRILSVILTAVTAGDGLGFNRAFLLLVDEAGSTIRGRMAVGPSHADEAALIWKAMAQEAQSLGDMLARSPAAGAGEGRGITAVADRLVFPLSPGDNILARSLEESASYVVETARDVPEARALASILRSDQFLVVPLVAEGKKLGAIVADNFITGRRILPEDARLVETFASQAALAILNASLHSKLRDRVSQLELAHQELTHNHLQLLRAERMVAAGGLAGALVHDLKAPVVSIGLMARAAASSTAGGPMRETLDQISQEIVRIEEYLKRFARSAGTGTRRMEDIDIPRLVEDCLGTVRGLIDRNRIKVVTKLGHGDAKVKGNRVELRQVMVNLLHNSVEAMPDGGTVTVVSTVEGGALKVSVEDTGTGISEQDQARVFSPFFTTKAEGSGLGLVIAKRIVTSYGGRITLDSKEGVGTCFSIHLPLAK